MADVYRIKDWEPFETAQSKGYKSLNWVCLTNKHDGGGYRRLMAHKDGTSLYGAWCLIVTVASKCEPRGTLINDGKPLTAEDLHFKTGGSVKIFNRAFEVLASPEIDWLELVSLKSAEVHASTLKSTSACKPTPPTQPYLNLNPTQPNQCNGEVGSLDDFLKERGIGKKVVGIVSAKLARITKMKGPNSEELFVRLAVMSQLEYTNEKTILDAASAVEKEKPNHPHEFFHKCLQNRIDDFEKRLSDIP